jgi:hypothetical protein
VDCLTPQRVRRTPKVRHLPGNLSNVCLSRSKNEIPEPATKSLTVLETMSLPGPAIKASCVAMRPGDRPACSSYGFGVLPGTYFSLQRRLPGSLTQL